MTQVEILQLYVKELQKLLTQDKINIAIDNLQKEVKKCMEN